MALLGPQARSELSSAKRGIADITNGLRPNRFMSARLACDRANVARLPLPLTMCKRYGSGIAPAVDILQLRPY